MNWIKRKIFNRLKAYLIKYGYAFVLNYLSNFGDKSSDWKELDKILDAFIVAIIPDRLGWLERIFLGAEQEILDTLIKPNKVEIRIHIIKLIEEAKQKP